MAKKSKNAPLSKRKQRELLRKAGLGSYSEINKLSNKDLQDLYNEILTESKPKQKKKAPTKRAPERVKPEPASAPTKAKKSSYQVFKDRVKWKREELERQGYKDAMQSRRWSDKQIDKIKISDLKNKSVNPEKYPWLVLDGKKAKFDFNKIYKLPDGLRLHMAYNSFDGNIDIEKVIKDLSKETDATLLSYLETAIHMPQTRKSNKPGSSSGKAGGYRFVLGSQEVISAFNKTEDAESKRAKSKYKSQLSGKQSMKKKRRLYKGELVQWQKIKDGTRTSYDEVTPRNLLIIANAFMYNLTEENRQNFYKRFYNDICGAIPEMTEILPRP